MFDEILAEITSVAVEAGAKDGPLLTSPTRENIRLNQDLKVRANELDSRERIRRDSHASAVRNNNEALNRAIDGLGALFGAKTK